MDHCRGPGVVRASGGYLLFLFHFAGLKPVTRTHDAFCAHFAPLSNTL